MAAGAEHSVGLRELRHDTGAVLARVRGGETIDVTQHGKLIARIVPVVEPATSPILDRLRAEGRLTPARRPGYRPAMRPGDGTNRYTDALSALREEESS